MFEKINMNNAIWETNMKKILLEKALSNFLGVSGCGLRQIPGTFVSPTDSIVLRKGRRLFFIHHE